MIALDDDLALLAPGGAYVPSARALVVADLHAGYVQTLQRRGYTLPAQRDDALLARLRAMMSQVDVARVIVAGDLVHGRPAFSAREGARSPLDALLGALEGRALTVVPGNHDRGSDDLLARRGVEMTDACAVGAHLVMHGDEGVDRLRGERALALGRGGRLVLGHMHPALALDDGAGARARVPAFAYASGLLCLPALAPLARGADLMREDHAAELTALATTRELSVTVIVGERLIAVGMLSRVRAARRAARDVG
ncbi:MAG: metallophosphoesterase [Polyangiales bacterium]